MINTTLTSAVQTRTDSTDTLEYLYTHYLTLVQRICYRYTKNRDEANDLTQEIFLKANASYAGFEGQSQTSTWLYRVAVNHCLDHLRWRKRQNELMANYAEELTSRPPMESALDNPVKRLFRRLLEGLDEANRQVVFLRFEVGMTHEEIAEICGVSRVAITKRLAKFLAKVALLKEELGDSLESHLPEAAYKRAGSDPGEEA